MQKKTNDKDMPPQICRPLASKSKRGGGNHKFFLKTYGCQMNKLDSEAIAGALSELGYEMTVSEKEADIILLNTCSVRDLAEKKALGKLGLLKKLKKKKGNLLIGLAGCLAQHKGEEILKKNPHLDFVVGTREIDRIPELIAEAVERKKRISALSSCREIKEPSSYLRADNIKAFVYVMRGCENYCSYCIVPYVRGPEKSRPSKDIVSEIKSLADSGYKEVCLLGQNVNSYGRGLKEGIDFSGLLEKINSIEGIYRIRFVTSHPKDISEKLIDSIADLDKVCESIHFPLQSGSDKILKLMNRGYDLSDYIKIVDRLRGQVPDVSISTDIIVGFPGETEEDFNRTVKTFEEIRFDSSFIFKYSHRGGTAASRLEDDVPFDVKLERNKCLLSLQGEISQKKNDCLIGEKQEVLVEGPSRKNIKMYTGRTRQNKIAIFPGCDDIKGKLVSFIPERASPNVFYGKIENSKL